MTVISNITRIHISDLLLRFLIFKEKFVNLHQMLHLVSDEFCDIWNVGRDIEQHIVDSLSSGKVEMFLCAACHSFTPHVNA